MNNDKKNNITISDTVFSKMIGQIIIDNKMLFIDKNYLKQKQDKKALKIDVDNNEKAIKVTLDLNANYSNNISNTAAKLQTEIKTVIENMTGYAVKEININIVKVIK
ncbi:Asp23/Gls24 family envelope stress response protein [Mycoplasma sp. P36-A1]|uniref:Asp23/Gls24 family envelope stress response protein n=1 Tax=Mycoplasma sp. P36-A1 TaxID=3252900 RepID=UPI003C2F5184